jgi:hypothetical protein
VTGINQPARRPNHERWTNAVHEATEALALAEVVLRKFFSAMENLKEAREPYVAWQLDREWRRSSEASERLRRIIEFDIESPVQALTDAMDEVRALVEEAASIRLPRAVERRRAAP